MNHTLDRHHRRMDFLRAIAFSSAAIPEIGKRMKFCTINAITSLTGRFLFKYNVGWFIEHNLGLNLSKYMRIVDIA